MDTRKDDERISSQWSGMVIRQRSTGMDHAVRIIF